MAAQDGSVFRGCVGGEECCEARFSGAAGPGRVPDMDVVVGQWWDERGGRGRHAYMLAGNGGMGQVLVAGRASSYRGRGWGCDHAGRGYAHDESRVEGMSCGTGGRQALE